MLSYIAAGSNSNGHTNHWVLALIGVFFVLIGGMNALKPQTAWRANRWQYKNKDALEPSAAGLMMSRVVGAVFVVIGIVMIISGLASL
jgi:uncharacterized membrane protein YidH (DUF202 family)